ncbi:MAG: hypothetical protein JO191_00915 [Mycobacteriaceae bacterium]|nr:hypothetical protein [Mycobacteriaceae bacterium]MBV9515467.1 hypothetical protein [Mycobacteriaceae bacterium]
MSVLEVHAFFVGIPLLLVIILATLIWSHKGPHPATYQMSEPWRHEPILWTAVDERVGDPHGHGSDTLTIGGGASGKW